MYVCTCVCVSSENHINRSTTIHPRGGGAFIKKNGHREKRVSLFPLLFALRLCERSVTLCNVRSLGGVCSCVFPFYKRHKSNVQIRTHDLRIMCIRYIPPSLCNPPRPYANLPVRGTRSCDSFSIRDYCYNFWKFFFH